ncbi:carbohydrate ABC transporter permease [Paenibacillus humicola]|uniref:carbohydrate ABC transporter permease n=1 Tax=Paenibacillus humicola TaxID=3110540 RepID=UPI00237B12D3|nr:carbohydrate ABC transporter permease [Paenibacillus humicola]
MNRKIAVAGVKSAANVLIAVFSLVSIFPILWVMYSSLKNQQEFSFNILSLPKSLHFDNYVTAFWDGKLYLYLWNSAFVSAISVVLTILIGFVSGYFLSRFSFRGRNVVYTMFLFGMLVPVYGLLVPLFIEYRNLHLLDHRLFLVLPEVTFALPLVIFLIESFMKSVPIEMEEAAYVDGANTVSTLFRIVFPICRPVLSTCIIISFLNIWNEFPFALILINSQELKTIPVGLTNFVGQYTINYPQLMAGINVSILPVIIVYLCLSKRIIQGMVAGAVKG